MGRSRPVIPMTFPLLDYRGPLPKGTSAEHFRVYEHIRDSDSCDDDRAALRDLWEQFKKLELADPEFVKRFPTEFGARVWEMRLACTFTGWGWKVVAPKKPGHGPDLGIEMSNGRVIWIEATAPGNAEGADVIHAPRRVVLNGDEIERKVMLRYLNAISEKRKQYKRWRQKGIVSEADGFVIAISGSMVPEGQVELDELPRIVKLAFGLGKRTVIVPIGDTKEEPHVGPRQTALTVTKNTQTGETEQITAAPFVNDNAHEVSAILFSGAHFKIRPEAYGNEPGRDFVLAHNPFANVSFPFDRMKSGREFFIQMGVCDHRAGVGGRDG